MRNTGFLRLHSTLRSRFRENSDNHSRRAWSRSLKTLTQVLFVSLLLGRLEPKRSRKSVGPSHNRDFIWLHSHYTRLPMSATEEYPKIATVHGPPLHY